jgi:hypothetical protein
LAPRPGLAQIAGQPLELRQGIGGKGHCLPPPLLPTGQDLLQKGEGRLNGDWLGHRGLFPIYTNNFADYKAKITLLLLKVMMPFWQVDHSIP